MPSNFTSKRNPAYVGIVDDEGKQLGTSANPLVTTGSGGVGVTSTQVTIASGQSLSDAIDVRDKVLTGILIPTGYAEGNMTIQASDTESGTYVDLYDSNATQIMIGVGGDNRMVAVVGYAMQAIASMSFIKLKTANNAAAARTITVLTKG